EMSRLNICVAVVDLPNLQSLYNTYSGAKLDTWGEEMGRKSKVGMSTFALSTAIVRNTQRASRPAEHITGCIERHIHTKRKLGIRWTPPKRINECGKRTQNENVIQKRYRLTRGQLGVGGFSTSHFPRRSNYDKYHEEVNRKILDERRASWKRGTMTLSLLNFCGRLGKFCSRNVVPFDKDTINDYLDNTYITSSNEKDDFHKMKHKGYLGSQPMWSDISRLLCQLGHTYDTNHVGDPGASSRRT
ncbi:hypothetical protein Lal_00042101, partial [Lupinus albus]